LHEALGDAGAQRHCALFFELEDRSQVHLDRVDQVVLVIHVLDCVALVECLRNSAG
jgi:hypothetical protein